MGLRFLSILFFIGCLFAVFIMIKIDRKMGLLQIITTIGFLIATKWFCSLKYQFAFGGTDWEFLIHSALVDRMFAPYFILLLFGMALYFFFRNFILFWRVRGVGYELYRKK